MEESGSMEPLDHSDNPTVACRLYSHSIVTIVRDIRNILKVNNIFNSSCLLMQRGKQK
jgi:hypothetical protein